MSPPDSIAALPHPLLIEQVRAGKAEIILDLSRLLSRVLHPMPTGVDRVEMAYARRLLELLPDHLQFAAVHPSGIYGRLDRRHVENFLDETEQHWRSGSPLSFMEKYAFAGRALCALFPRRVPRAGHARRLYLQASPNHLFQDDIVARKLRREGAKFICLVHDLIPIEYPEYARPDGAELHRRRMETLARRADILIANSAATARSMRQFLANRPRQPIVVAAPLGTERLRDNGDPLPLPISRPYFLFVGTIEPRKNHLLLLNIWRQMVATLGDAATPDLVIVGRRGWENENVLDMLERCESIHSHVHEVAGLSDAGMAAFLKSARALLLPSFAEGFGMPVTEALAFGTPVICSDIPALREAGGDVPEYLAPLDGPAWTAQILDYVADASPRRAAQLARMRDMALPSWADHIDQVLDAMSLSAVD